MEDGTLLQFTEWDEEPEKVAVPLMTGVISVKASETHGLALKKDGSVWGIGRKPQLIREKIEWETTEKPYQLIKTGGRSISTAPGISLITQTNGTLWALGNNKFGQFGDGTLESSLELTAAARTLTANLPAENANGLFSIKRNQLILDKPIPPGTDNLPIQIVERANDGTESVHDFEVKIEVVQEPPEGLGLTSLDITEDSSPGTIVGKLVANDPDPGDHISFQLHPGTKKTPNDNHHYIIKKLVTGEMALVLSENAKLDHETEPIHDVRVRAVDQGGLYTDRTFRIRINNVSEPPGSIQLSTNEIVADKGEWGLVSYIEVVDDPGDFPECKLTMPEEGQNNDNRMFSIYRNRLYLRPGNHLGSVQKRKVGIQIEAKGKDKKSFIRDFELEIRPPVKLRLENTKISADSPVGSPIGKVLTDSRIKNLKLPGIRDFASSYEIRYHIDTDGNLWRSWKTQEEELKYIDGDPIPMEKIASDVIQVATYNEHVLFVKSNGSLWGFGKNKAYQLGIGKKENQKKPVKIKTSGVTKAFAGYESSFFIDADGALWGFGRNNFGGFGIGPENSELKRPMKLLPNGVADVACGYAHTLDLMQDGSLFAMGINHAGQLGNGTTQTSYHPAKVRDNGVVSISAYGSYSLFVMEDGTAWHMGKHESDPGPDLPRLEPKKLPVKDVVQAICNPWFVLCLKKDGSITDLKIAGYSKGRWGEEVILKKSGVNNIKGTKYSNLIHNGNGTLEAYYSYMPGGSPWDIVDAVDTGNTVHPEILHHNKYLTIKGNQILLAKPLGRNPPKELTAYVQAQTQEGLPVGALFKVSLIK